MFLDYYADIKNIFKKIKKYYFNIFLNKITLKNNHISKHFVKLFD